MTTIVDTNVILVANHQHDEISPQCVASCALKLQEIIKSGKVALDDDYLILNEYQNKTTPKTGNRPGDAFLKWLLRNYANPDKCELVPITEHEHKGFAEFPDDERLADLDPSDRKFVAVSAAHPTHPPIYQAADSKWLDWSKALQDHGINVTFLCLDDIQRFHDNKFGA